MLFAIVLAAVSSLSAVEVESVQFEELDFSGFTFDICRVKLGKGDFRIDVYYREDDENFRSIGAIRQKIKEEGDSIIYAINGGMYNGRFEPVGLYVENGEEFFPLNLMDGYGNFYLKPNGVFMVGDKGARIMESSLYPEIRDSVIFATQSGPLLVIDGEYHYAFNDTSPNTFVRTGVGVAAPDEILFGVSDREVNFYTFASLFREALECKNALYLDGNIYRVFSPEQDRIDTTGNLGVFIGVTKTK